MGEVFIEDLAAQADFGDASQAPQEAVVRKFVGEREGAVSNLTFDDFEALAGAAKVGFRGWPLDRGAVTDTIDTEIELDSAAGPRRDAAREPLAAH
ncbi:MAG: hypothetical protein WDO56_32630 [Gammaproteobacteria bacterium]